MKIRDKKYKYEGYSNTFNMHGVGEVLVNWDDGGGDSCFIRDLDVFVNNEWKDMSTAFREDDLETDNYNTIFYPSQKSTN